MESALSAKKMEKMARDFKNLHSSLFHSTCFLGEATGYHYALPHHQTVKLRMEFLSLPKRVETRTEMAKAARSVKCSWSSHHRLQGGQI